MWVYKITNIQNNKVCAGLWHKEWQDFDNNQIERSSNFSL